MELTSYVDTLRQELAVAAAAGGDEARALAERLTAPLESATRLVLLEVLATAAAEITRDLAPGSVDLRLRGREPMFVVTPPPADPWEEAPDPGYVAPSAPSMAPMAPAGPAEGEDDAVARINFRLPEHLKARIEQAAAQAGTSVNAWLIRVAAAAVEPVDPRPQAARRPSTGGDRYSGWVR
jgi:hypothetical protein